MGNIINIVVIDAKPLIRLGVRYSLISFASEIQIVAELGSVAETKKLMAETGRFDVVFLDPVLPDGDGLKLVRLIRNMHPEAKVMAALSENSVGLAGALFDLGCDGIFSKMGDGQELVKGILRLARGDKYYSASIVKQLGSTHVAQHRVNEILTEREADIVSLCAQGLSAKQIGEKLFLSYRTIECHKHNIFKKLGLSSTAELIRYAYDHGMVKP